jgi:hypothetical protein
LGWTLGRLASSLLASGPSLPAQQRIFRKIMKNQNILLMYFSEPGKNIPILPKSKNLFGEKYF